MTGQPGIIDLVADVEGYTEENFGTGERPAGFDSDEDGIADDWELANGLNPNDASDAALYTIAAQFHVQALAIFTVSDHLLTGEACSAEERQTTFTDMMKIALETAIQD